MGMMLNEQSTGADARISFIISSSLLFVLDSLMNKGLALISSLLLYRRGET